MAEDGLPQMEGEAPEDFGELVETPVSLFDKIRYWAPAALFAASLVVAGLTIIMNPISMRERRKTPEEYYLAGRESLEKVIEGFADLPRLDKIDALLASRVNLRRLIRHYSSTDVFRSGKLENPYLMLAESDFQLSGLMPREVQRELLTEASRYFNAALALETMAREEEDEIAWQNQFGSSLTPNEVAIREERRARFINYRLAQVDMLMSRNLSARTKFEGLRNAIQNNEMISLRKERRGFTGTVLDDQLLPASYELLPEDRIRIHWFLGRIYDEGGETDKAEREYRTFLLRAPRSRERFLAMMRMGKMMFDRARENQDSSTRAAGEERERLNEETLRQYSASADYYSAVVEESAPEDILREAYYRGGVANLHLASVIDVGRETSWDYIDKTTNNLLHQSESFFGKKLRPEVYALGKPAGLNLLESSAVIPSAAVGGARFIGGGLMSLASGDRVTPREERESKLRLARSYFDAAGISPDYEAESRIMTGLSLLVEGRPEEARRIFSHAMKNYPRNHIRAAAQQGIGRTYLYEEKLDDAWKTYITMDEVEDPAKAIFLPRDTVSDLLQLAQAYVRHADSLTFPPEWMDSPIGSPNRMDAIQRTRDIERSVSQAIKVYEKLRADYKPPEVSTRVELAGLYARHAEILSGFPFGKERDLARARALNMRAADAYAKLAVEIPGSPFDEEVLLKSGTLFHDSFAFERAAETLELYRSRHGQSERIGQALNLLGMSYQKLGLYDRAETVLRMNARDSTTAEGRKSLYNLGETYRLWSRLPNDRGRLGGRNSKYLMSNREGASDAAPYTVYPRDVTDWKGLISDLRRDGISVSQSPGNRLREFLGPKLVSDMSELDLRERVPQDFRDAFLKKVNEIILRRDFYDENSWKGIEMGEDSTELLRRGVVKLAAGEIAQLNRLLLEEAYPEYVVPNQYSMRRDPIPENAREVFEYVRRLPGIGPESRPWRWSTFALAETLFEIAENERLFPTPPAQGISAADAERRRNEVLRALYADAVGGIREALNRYPLFPWHPDGLRQDIDPQGFDEVRKARFVAYNNLAMCYRATNNDPLMQDALSQMLDADVFSPEVWSGDTLLSRMYRNAYFFLGLSRFRTGNYSGAYEIFELAHDKLKTSEGPYLLYMMGESLRLQGRAREARSRYIQARHAVRAAGKPEEGSFASEFGVDYWQNLNEQRIKDLEYLARADGLAQ